MQGASKRLPRAFRAHGSDDTLISDFWDTASKHAAPPVPRFGTCESPGREPTEPHVLCLNHDPQSCEMGVVSGHSNWGRPLQQR